MPDGCSELVFNLADPFEQVTTEVGATRQPWAMLVGPTSKPVFVRPTGRVDVIGVRLQPWAVAAVCGVPATELRDRLIALDDLSVRLKRLADVVANTDPARRPGLLQDWLVRSARATDSCNIAQALVEAIRAADQPPSVSALARRFGRSVRAVQRIFARDVGVGPKTTFRIAQVQRALGLARRYPARSWAWVAARAGYYDQPHLVRDFRELVGLLPSQFRPEAGGLTTAFVET